jgi:hypothetical protein
MTEPARSPRPDALVAALRHAAREAAGRVVLRVDEAAPHRRRVARALLQEGALAAGGQVLDAPDGALLLVGAEPQRAERLRALVERLVGPAGTGIWTLDRDGGALLAHAGGAALPPPVATGPELAGLDAAMDSLPLAPLLARRIGRRDGTARPAFRRLAPDRAAIAAAIGQLGADPDLLDHAAQRLARRLLTALAEPAQARGLFGGHRPERLHLPLPELAAGPATPARGVVATLPLAALAEPGFRNRAAALAEADIGLELETGAAALALLDPAALPPEALLRIEADPGEALGALDPARLVLAGAAATLAGRLPGAIREEPA